MEKVKYAVAESTTSPENLVRYQEIDLHIIFYTKLGKNFRLKSRLFAGRTQYKGPDFNYIQFVGITIFSAYMYTDCVTQKFRYPFSIYRRFLPVKLPAEIRYGREPVPSLENMKVNCL